MNLFLDDVRKPIDCRTYINDPIYSSLEWTVAKSYDQFVEIITVHFNKNKILPELISFDHDLAEEHYDSTMYTSEYNKLYSTFKEKTGKECAQWLVDFCIDNKLKLPHFKVHSMNPAGGRNISGLLNQFARLQEEGKI